jgi:hypothetical protein
MNLTFNELVGVLQAGASEILLSLQDKVGLYFW